MTIVLRQVHTFYLCLATRYEYESDRCRVDYSACVKGQREAVTYYADKVDKKEQGKQNKAYMRM